METRFEAAHNPKTTWATGERPFRDRNHAGEILAKALEPYRNAADLLILALPRGGVPVAAVVARQLSAELDVVVVRKLGAPGHEELALGALASGGVRVMNPDVVETVHVTEADLEREIERESAELERREAALRGTKPPVRITGRTVILVDDGVATGATMRSAIRAVRAQRPRKLVVATPIAPLDALATLRREADDVVCALSATDFYAIGQFYWDFSQVTTAAARKQLDYGARSIRAASSVRGAPSADDTTIRLGVEIPVRGAEILATLTLPATAVGVVAFAHGSGSSRFSARNRFVARTLERAGFATLLVDLLTLREEAEDRANGRFRFDIELLTERVVAVIDWLTSEGQTSRLPIGLFGASTGAAAALAAAAERPNDVLAIVSRGGRPDLATASLPRVQTPTLLIVGSNDTTVLELNRAAGSQLHASHQLEVIAGASHLFEEAGKLEIVADLAAEFFREHLTPAIGNRLKR